MRHIGCEACGETILARRATKKFCETCRRRRSQERRRSRAGAQQPAGIVRCQVCDVTCRTKRHKTCSSACAQTYRRFARLAHLKGLSVRQFLQLRDQTRCAICGRHRSDTRHGVLDIDHDHENGQARAPICPQCNMILGMARDNISILEAAIDYLRAWGKHPRGLNVREYVYAESATE